MDALSMLLENVHLSETKYYRLTGSGNWSYSITRKDTILFYLVISGSFCMDVGGSLRQAHAGDMIMIPNTYQHVSYAMNHNGDNAQALDDQLLHCKEHAITLSDIENSEEIGESNSCVILIECQYDKEMVRPLLSVLPSILPEIHDLPESRFEVIDVAIKLLALGKYYDD